MDTDPPSFAPPPRSSPPQPKNVFSTYNNFAINFLLLKIIHATRDIMAVVVVDPTAERIGSSVFNCSDEVCEGNQVKSSIDVMEDPLSL